ncbi:MAG: glycogen debranching protein [Dorea sp.]|nr:glycogen debranching protein [Dorea sp.]
MKQTQGTPLPLGVTGTDKGMNFAVAVPQGKECELLLYQKGGEVPVCVCELTEETAVGEVRCVRLKDMDDKPYEYLYRIDGENYVDPYTKRIIGVKVSAERKNLIAGQLEEPKKSISVEEANHGTAAKELRGELAWEQYDWEGDRPLNIPMNRVVAYSLHVRGFTRHSSSKVKHKGTFQGVVEKIPYLTELGINQIHCMPVYEFEERTRTVINYWGYGPGYYFAPKKSYSASGDAVTEFKDMVKSCHKAGIEVVLEMPFDGGVSKQMMQECLRYYMMEYHADGFILNPGIAPMDMIYADPILKKVKILTHKEDFQNTMRRFLKGDEGMVGGVIYWLNQHTRENYNYITSQNGFTLNDLVSYDCKHNEANGENNQDGPDYNYSWNCGAEGPSRKKAVNELRKNQIRNAFLLLLFAQGTPCILAGDEFGNTQKGNNNVYCQDNPISWLDWSKLKRQSETFELVKKLIALRKSHPVFMQEEPLRGLDSMRCGIPDVSYHGEYAWRTPDEFSSRQLGVYYSGAVVGDEDYFIIYNMHWLEHSFALPALSGKRKWYVIVSTKEGVLKEPKLLENQHETIVAERTILILAGR